MRPSASTIRWISLALLLCFWGTRILSLTSFPPFIDESYQIYYSEELGQRGSLLATAGDGRILTFWLHYVFASYMTASTFWIGRIVIILSMIPGIASMLAIARGIAGWRALLLMGIFMIFNNYLMFFNRLALADSTMASFVLLAVYFAYRLSRRLAYRDAVIVGILVFLGILAKVSALPYLGIPLAAGLCLRSKDYTWRKQAIWTGIGLAVGGGLTVLMNLVLVWRGYNIFMHLSAGERGTTLDWQGLIRSASSNLSLSYSVFDYYLPPFALILFLLAFVILVLKRRFYLPLVLFAPFLVSLISSWYATRNIVVSMFLLLLGGALILANSLDHQSRRLQALIMGFVMLIFVGWWTIFSGALITDPASAPLFPRDHIEYVSADSSGFGLEEVAERLDALEPKRVIGIFPNCYALRYIALDRLPIECPRLNPSGATIPYLVDLIDANRHVGTYVLLEPNDYTPATVAGELIDTISHATARPDILLYDLRPEGAQQ